MRFLISSFLLALTAMNAQAAEERSYGVANNALSDLWFTFQDKSADSGAVITTTNSIATSIKSNDLRYYLADGYKTSLSGNMTFTAQYIDNIGSQFNLEPGYYCICPNEGETASAVCDTAKPLLTATSKSQDDAELYKAVCLSSSSATTFGKKPDKFRLSHPKVFSKATL